MDTRQYKAICELPDVMSRGVLEDSAREISLHLGLLLREILEGAPVPKPKLHNGDESTDYFHVDIGLEEAEETASDLLSAETDAVSPEGDTTPEASYIASLVDEWNRYIEFREQTKMG